MVHLLNYLYVAAAVVLLFGAAVFVHEFGHYWMARRRGLKVEAFSIGFGPKILGWTRDGIEPTKGAGPFQRFDMGYADQTAREKMHEIGIDVRDTGQLVGTLSGGERQTLAIARAEYFGARVLILDEPTSALGVKQAAIVLRHILKARASGLAVIFITHNVQHALPVGDKFTILSHGRSEGVFRRGEVDLDHLLSLMGGGQELSDLSRELEQLQNESMVPAADPETAPAG